MAGKYIYVPQARAAIMTEASIKQGVLGLYSNEFSSCVLAIFRNQTKKSLLYFHADFACVMDQTGSQAVKKLISDFKENKDNKMTIELYYREDGKNTVLQLYNILKDLKNNGITFGEPEAYTLDSKNFLDGGIYADLDQKLAIAVIPADLNCPLEYHPEMERIKLIRRIEEFVTHRALQTKIPYAPKTICVFDGVQWISPLPLEYDLRIDCTNKAVDEDMKLLETLRDDKKLTVNKVEGILQILKNRGAKFADIKEAAKLLYPNLVDYFKEVPTNLPQVENVIPAQVPTTKLFIESIGTRSQKDQILDELHRITECIWSSNTDGTKFWLKADKTLVGQIMKHISDKSEGVVKITENTPDTTIFIEDVKLPSLKNIPTIISSSTKEEVKNEY